MWNEKKHSEQVSAYDEVQVYVHFDQAIVHELEYIENDLTQFYLEATLQGTPLATLKANRVLPELMEEAKQFRNGKFKFPLCCLPNALSQSFHAAFAQYMATQPEGLYEIALRFFTDNPLQAGKVLAESSFRFEIAQGAQAHLQRIADENIAQGADKEEDAAVKIAAFERIKQPSEQLDYVQLTLQNRGAGDIWVMIGYNSGQKHLVNYQDSLTLVVAAGEEVYKYENNQCTTNFGYIGKKQAAQSLEIY
jgi:hypothetical protein